MRNLVLATGLIVWLAPGKGSAQTPPSYAKQVRPFFAQYCLECHNAATTKGDLDLETYQGLRRGGKSGPVVVPGKPDISRLVLLPEGKDKPPMPPKKARQPKPEEVAILRAWVSTGAKDDSTETRISLPSITPRIRRPEPIAALAYAPNGKWLAVGQGKAVLIIDVVSNDIIGRLSPQPGNVTALAFRHDGQLLAVATSAPGTDGSIGLHQIANGRVAESPAKRLHGHHDAIHDVAFSPDGTMLASTGYDRLIKLWDVGAATELRTLKDHSDAVYSLAWSPDGRLLASAAADRAVKIWDVHSGRRLYTLGESTDWVYAVAWSPDGRRVAGAGVDKSIRVWEVTATNGRLVQSVFGHEAGILRLAYADNGKTLLSLSEDRTAKAWDAAQMTERRVYPRQQEAVLAMAVSPDGKRLALGRYDGVVVVLDPATGNQLAQPLPSKPKPPTLSSVQPAAGPRGRPLRVTFAGAHLADAVEVTSTQPGTVVKLLPDGRSDGSLVAELTFPAQMPAGSVKLAVRTPAGLSAPLPFVIDLFGAVQARGSNDSPHTAQPISLSATITGTLARAGLAHFYSFEVRERQEIGVQALTGPIGSKLEPVLELFDANGFLVGESVNGSLGYSHLSAGKYVLGIHDRDYRGGNDWTYRLHVGQVPVVSAYYPLGLRRGSEIKVYLEGANLGDQHSVLVKAPPDAVVGSRIPLAVRTPLGPAVGEPSVVVGEYPEVISAPNAFIHRNSLPPWDLPSGILGERLTDKRALTVPGTGNGRIDRQGRADEWSFIARKGQRLILEVEARRLGSPLDSYLEILDAAHQPVQRATLRCVAKTYVTFRDHESSGANIRMETWNEFAMNDYVWVGNELLRIHELPKNPDDDCFYYAEAGQRRGYLDTTPMHLCLGTPMYKVNIHPPGTTFPPNGFPVIQLPYRNDDGGPGYGKDSRLTFDPPADGTYFVKIGDSRGQAGASYAYRLTIRPPRPSFSVSFTPTVPSVSRGSAAPITVTATRIDGFEGPIQVHLQNLPPGLDAPPTTIPEGENSTTFALWAAPDALPTKSQAFLKLVASAEVEGKTITHEVTGGMPTLLDPGVLVTRSEQDEVTVQPGRQVWLTARIERQSGFTGRVPLEVRGLPHGVRVLDIGLNGILITEKESSRTFAIYAEPWVKPTTHPFVVLARHEAKGTEFAARSVLLKVKPTTPDRGRSSEQN